MDPAERDARAWLPATVENPTGDRVLAAGGAGAILEDAAGNRYVDWIMGRGALLLGYRHPEVDAAVRAQLDVGTVFSVPHALEVEVADRLGDLVPCAERVAFGKNGSDVCTAAVRVARAVTGRPGVLHFGYHGFHDWIAAVNPTIEGLPPGLRELIHSLRYDDVNELRAILTEHGERIAAVILEPTRTALPSPGYLEGVRALTREHGCLLIFDEMVTGFRLARGGAQELFGVTPDLACLGKALTNGLPLSALVGRCDLIDVLDRVGYGMTARGETLALAAARASLEVYGREPVAETVRRVGEAVRKGFAAGCARAGIEATLVGHPSMLTFELPDGWLAPFVSACRSRGVLTNGHLLPSTAHGDAEVDASCRVFEAAIAECADRG